MFIEIYWILARNQMFEKFRPKYIVMLSVLYFVTFLHFVLLLLTYCVELNYENESKFKY